MNFKLFIMAALLCASQVKIATASEDPSIEDLKKRFSKIHLGGVFAAASASTTEPTKASPKKGIRRIVSLDDLRKGYLLRPFATYSIDGNIVKIDSEDESVTINRARHPKPERETYTDYVYRILRSKKKSKEAVEKNSRRRQILMAKRRMATNPV